uniref:Retrovirus-related Pol polyprotein from transposon opus n=1 Tax=Bactrocera latifrons TaxID=174628 RepID=A0A0K8W2Q0_BACLA
MASLHKISDKNMCTIKIKLLERIFYLGVPEKMIMDNEFNNSLIRMFCRENNIVAHFTTPGSHTGNSDIERFHSTIIEHIRILKNSKLNESIEEIAMRAVGFYNSTVHSTTEVKPFDFLTKTDLDFEQIKRNIHNEKTKAIERINKTRDKIPDFNNKELFIKNPQAKRNKLHKRYHKFNRNNPNKIDIACVHRPLKVFK